MKSLVCSLTVLLTLSHFVGTSSGASAKCTIVEVDDKTMVVHCEKILKRFPKGTKVKIKSVKTKQIEGC